MADKEENQQKESPTTEEKPHKEPNVTYTNIAEAPSIYINRMELALGRNEIRLRLCEILQADEADMIVRVLQTVYISPYHAKKISQLFIRQMEKYEERFGPIPDQTS